MYSEKIADSHVTIYGVDLPDGLIHSYKEPLLIKKPGGYVEVTYYHRQEGSVWVNEDELDIFQSSHKVKDVDDLFVRKFKIYKDDPDCLVLIRDEHGDIRVPKAWSEKQVSQLLGKRTILTNLTELSYV